MALALRSGRFDPAEYLQGQKMKQARERQTAMFGQMQTQSREAEAASQAKYQEMLGVAGETTGQRQADIRQDYASRAADITQQQARLGMSGTTVGTSLRGGVEREKQSSLNRLADTMQQTKLGIMGQQAAVGERFAGQRQAMMGQQAQLSSAIPVAQIGAEAQKYASDAELRKLRERRTKRVTSRGWGGGTFSPAIQI